jgi:hypothetical protein
MADLLGGDVKSGRRKAVVCVSVLKITQTSATILSRLVGYVKKKIRNRKGRSMLRPSNSIHFSISELRHNHHSGAADS